VRHRLLRAASIGLLPVTWACARPDSAAQDDAASDDAGATAQAAPPPAAVSQAAGSPVLETVATDAVHLRAGPGGTAFEVVLRTSELGPSHTRRIGRRTFDIALRSVELKEYPCSRCHTQGRIVRDDRVADAHQHVQPVHPSDAAACATCHVTSDVARLRLDGGETVPLDQAYRLCARCHFQQVDAWAGGAHGKRLDGWQGRRVLMGCTDCHDPHQPTVPQRIPFPGPNLNRREPHQP
jgi:hypothetical protein